MTETTVNTPESDKEHTVIELARPEDAEQVAELLRVTWMATYPNPEIGITEEDIRLRTEGENGERIPQNVEKWRQSIENTDGSRAIFVAREGEKIVGVVATAINSTENKKLLRALYVLPAMHGKGIGGQLMKKALEWLGDDGDIYLNVASYNQKAINFYSRFGFKQTNNPVTDEGNVYGNTRIPEIEMVCKQKELKVSS